MQYKIVRCACSQNMSTFHCIWAVHVVVWRAVTMPMPCYIFEVHINRQRCPENQSILHSLAIRQYSYCYFVVSAIVHVLSFLVPARTWHVICSLPHIFFFYFRWSADKFVESSFWSPETNKRIRQKKYTKNITGNGSVIFYIVCWLSLLDIIN